MRGRINTTGWRPTYYQAQTIDNGRRVSLTGVRVPRGISIFAARGWDRSLREGLRIGRLNTDGNIFIENGVFTPEQIGANASNYKGQMIGLMVSCDQAGQGRAVGTVPLGNYVVQNRSEHLQAIIEIVPSVDQNKLTVIERRLETKGLVEDRSKHVYTLTAAGRQMIENEIIDLSWIRAVRVQGTRVEVDYVTPNDPAAKTLALPAIAFRDNDGKSLLNNKAARMTSVNDIYQADFYPAETIGFKPQLDEMHGNLRLIVHKVDRYEIKRPEGFTIPDGVKIFPTAADAAAQINGQWVPLTLQEPLAMSTTARMVQNRLQSLPLPPGVKKALTARDVHDMIDYNLSQVNEGALRSAIGPQTRFGEPNNISSEYVRDPYFYGLAIEAMFSTIEKFGETFAINRAKSVRAARGIQSGRTHVMPYTMLFNAFADIMPTNNQYYKKLSNFAEEIWGPGVSEDTQMEMAYWLKGVKMWVVKEMVALMAAEKEWGRYDTQNTKRYDYSEVLFNLSFLLAKVDVWKGRLFGKQPVLMNWQEMSEIAAGRTWYKMPHAKITELSTIISYLGSLGHVLFYPVDLVYFIGAWLGRTVASSINYTQHLMSLGYGFFTGFWKNPALELTMLAGYFRAAMKQWLERNQYGTFMLTVGGSGELIPKANRRLVWGFALTTGASIAVSSVLLTFGGLVSWLALPFGIGAILSGRSIVAKGLNDQRGWRRAAVAAGGLALSGAGTVLTIAGLPVLAANLLSIAVIANLGFGLYSLGLLVRSIFDIKRAQREDEIMKKGHPNKQDLSTGQQQTVINVENNLRRIRQNLSYEQLDDMREELRQVMREIGAMDERGRVFQGIEHPYRLAIHRLRDAYASVEATLVKKACRDLINNNETVNAKAALLDLLKTSREYLVIDFAAKTYRRFNLNLNMPVS